MMVPTKISSVSQVNLFLKNLFDQEPALNRIYVQGEISNCKYHSSGHVYFSLKDATSQLSCVMFAQNARNQSFRLQEGQMVIVFGRIGVYEKNGSYQLYANSLQLAGEGALYEEYERLKKRLLKEGLFDASYKKEIPRFARRIGVVTARTGAVIQDICNVSNRRNPYVQIILYPAKVQGEGAYQTIIRGIEYFEQTDVDTIIIGRGGGSIEDLWAFNEEALVRKVFACTKPIISAVGHETDTTLTDYAADLRAPTPSAAAELAVYHYRDFQLSLKENAYTLHSVMEHRIKYLRLCVSKMEITLKSYNPKEVLHQKRIFLSGQEEKIKGLFYRKYDAVRHQMSVYIERLQGLSPLQKLSGGYAYVENENHENIRSVNQLETGDTILLSFADGQATATVEQKRKEE